MRAAEVAEFSGAEKHQRPSGRPYCATDGRDLDNYFEQVRQMCEPIANPFCYYEALLDQLKCLPKLRLVTVRDLARGNPDCERMVCLRHDVDADPLTALRIARHLARVGSSGSFYLLHTAPYYADRLAPGLVVRNGQLAHWIRGLIVSGAEVGLHYDPLGVVKEWGIDGIAAMKCELSWLRSQGLHLSGVVAHNSGPAYGAENYEVFSDRVLWPRDVEVGDGLLLPLGRLALDELGLEYEGTFAAPRSDVVIDDATAFFADTASANIRSESWMRRYLADNPACRWTLDAQCWLLGKDSWAIAGYFRDPHEFIWDAQLEDVLHYLSDLPESARAMLVIHPEYVSR